MTDLPRDPHDWIDALDLRTTAEVQVPDRLMDQVIGQDEAVAVAKKAAQQRRHLLLIGDPGTGKSMIARAMAELLPQEELPDVLAWPNEKDPNQPFIRTETGGQAKAIVQEQKEEARKVTRYTRILEWGLALGLIGLGIWWFVVTNDFLALMIALLVSIFFLYLVRQMRGEEELSVPNLIIQRGSARETAPYVDATGAHAGALLGDVRHDPYQSGGLETPVHQRVEPGAIHKAHKGVLFIDEINTLQLESQQSLLTAIQDGEYQIVGQSESSSGASVRTEPVPCDFILVAAGNLDAIKPEDPMRHGMHPALRSRIQGYGYEVYVNHKMPDTDRNRRKLVRFVAQEVERDGRIPHFDMAAVAEIIREAQRRAGRTGKLTLRLRELGGLVRTAGDVARQDSEDLVRLKHVRQAKSLSKSLEQQITDREVGQARSREALETTGELVGSAKGLAVIGTGEVGEPAGVVVPVEAAVSPAADGARVTAGDTLGTVAPDAADRAGPILRALVGDRDADVHLDALVRRRDQLRADGIGLAAVVAGISAVEAVPVRQDVALAGVVAISGEVRHVPAPTQHIEAAADVGYEAVVVPEACRDELLLSEEVRDAIDVVFVRDVGEALEVALADGAVKEDLAARLEA